MRTAWASVASSNGYADSVACDVAAADTDDHTVTEASAEPDVLSQSKSDEDSCRFLESGNVASSNDYTGTGADADEEEQLTMS